MVKNIYFVLLFIGKKEEIWLVLNLEENVFKSFWEILRGVMRGDLSSQWNEIVCTVIREDHWEKKIASSNTDTNTLMILQYTKMAFQINEKRIGWSQ